MNKLCKQYRLSDDDYYQMYRSEIHQDLPIHMAIQYYKFMTEAEKCDISKRNPQLIIEDRLMHYHLCNGCVLHIFRYAHIREEYFYAHVCFKQSVLKYLMPYIATPPLNIFNKYSVLHLCAFYIHLDPSDKYYNDVRQEYLKHLIQLFTSENSYISSLLEEELLNDISSYILTQIVDMTGFEQI